jgi:hypothetical protein
MHLLLQRRARLPWRNVRTNNLRDFEGDDGERLLTNGVEADPKEARRKVETAWQMAKENGWRDPSGRLIE